MGIWLSGRRFPAGYRDLFLNPDYSLCVINAITFTTLKDVKGKNSDSSFLSKFPGLLLFCFLGIYPLMIAYSLYKQPGWRWPQVLNPFKQIHWSWAGSISVGVITMIWIIVQIQWIPLGFLHIFVFAWGVLILIVTLSTGVRMYCTQKI
jgi:hypothetical protein